jgi:hypothetical protein
MKLGSFSLAGCCSAHKFKVGELAPEVLSLTSCPIAQSFLYLLRPSQSVGEVSP